MKDFLGFLFGFVLLPQQVTFLFGGKIAPPQLILANPSECFLTVCKAERHGRKADFGVILKNCITVVAINKGVAPHDQRRQQLAFLEDIFFKLLKFIIGQRRNLGLEAVDWYADVVKQYNPGVKLHMEWDVGEGGHDTYYVPATMHNFQDNLPEHDYSSATASYGLSSLTQCVKDNGCEIRYETALVKLEREENSRVTGVIAKNDKGEYIRINASKGVVLCCGGYAYNKQMLATLNPDAYLSTVQADASALDTGDGIKAAMWVGAEKDPDGTAMLFDRGTIAPDRVSDGNWEKSGYFHLGSQPWLKVNLNGERFSNESVPYDFILHAAFMEPGHLYNTIYDSSWVEQVKQFQQIGCARIEPSKSGGKLQIFSWEVEKGLLEGMEQAGFVQKADTLEELAEKLNMPVDTFAATVKRYNELCAKGEDEDFGKDSYRLLPLNNPPYYGCRQGASLLCTLDGLRINTQMQVLDTEGRPIEGLYAAGDCSGGFFAHNYPEYIVGVAVGRTLTEGYLVGDALAKA